MLQHIEATQEAAAIVKQIRHTTMNPNETAFWAMNMRIEAYLNKQVSELLKAEY